MNYSLSQNTLIAFSFFIIHDELIIRLYFHIRLSKVNHVIYQLVILRFQRRTPLIKTSRYYLVISSTIKPHANFQTFKSVYCVCPLMKSLLLYSIIQFQKL